MRRTDRVEITREVQIDVLHGNNLRVAPASGAALDSEARAQRWLAQADGRALSDTVEAISKADRGGRLALARRSWTDCGNEDKPSQPGTIESCKEIKIDLRNVAPVGMKGARGNAKLFRYGRNWRKGGSARN